MSGTAAGQDEPTLRGEPAAGRFLHRAGPGAAFVVAGAALLASALTPLGLWRPVVVWPVLLVVVALAWRLAGSLPSRPVPVWSALLCGGTAVAHGVWAAATHAEHVVLRRDSGSYALYAQWLATRGGLPVDARLSAFGGPDVLRVPGFTLASPAYYQVLDGPAADPSGAHVVPQFLVGAPALWSLGWWVDGWGGLLVVPALVSALAVLAVGGLAARLVGPRWAPLAAGALALTFPVLHVARSTYSEAPALLLVAAAASLVVDATRAGRASGASGASGGPATARPAGVPGPDAARRLGLAGGLVLGLAGLVRVDALREVALVLPVCALLALRGHPAARPVVVGALAGTAVSALAALGLSLPYLSSIAGSLLPLVAAFVVLGPGSLAVVVAVRRRAGRAEPARTLPDGAAAPPTVRPGVAGLPRVAGAGVVLLGVLLAARPLLGVVRQSAADPGARYVRALQLRQGLPLDGARTYAEQSLGWVVWWTGPAVVVAAWVSLAVVTATVVRWFVTSAPQGPEPGPARTPPWLAPALVGLGSVALTLYRPGITPDHPWADRRLVPVVLPVVVLAATAAAATAFRWARRRTPVTLLAGVTVVAVGALLVPAALATAPLAGVRTERGETAAVAAVCAALRPGDVVLAVDARAANEWPQLVRGVCRHPSAALRVPGPQDPAERAAAVAAVREVSRRVAAATVDGRPGRLVLLAAGGDLAPEETLAAAGATSGVDGGPVTRAVSLVTVEDARLLTRRPDGVVPLTVDVRLGVAPR